MQPTNAPKPEPSLVDLMTEVLTEVRDSREEFRRELKETRDEVRQEIQRLEERLDKDIQRLEDRLDTEVKRWDERFFQLSRDTLGFTRTVVTTAAVVAVLIPLLKDVAPLLIEVLTGGS